MCSYFLLIRDSFVVSEIVLPNNFTLEERAGIEIVGASIKVGNEDVAIFSYYNPPDVIINNKLLNFIENHDNFILLGDLNAIITKFGTPNRIGKEFNESLKTFKGSCINPVDQPTFFRHIFGELVSTSTLDLILTSEHLTSKLVEFDTKEISAVQDDKASYFHVPVTVSFNFNHKPKKKRISYHEAYLYNKVNWKSCIETIERSLKNNDSEELSSTDLNNKIVNAYLVGASACITKSKDRINRNNNFPSHILILLDSRNFWSKKFKSHRVEVFANKYKEYEKKVNEAIIQFRLEQWEEFLKRQGPHPLSSIPFWKRINRLRENKRQKNMGNFIEIGQMITESEGKANMFAKDLEKKFKSENNPNFNQEHKSNVEDFIRNGGIETNFTPTQKTVPEFTLGELNTALKEMNSKTSIDPLGMSNKLIKMTRSGNYIKGKVLELFNRCLNDGQVPSVWKHSHITMLLKNGLISSLISSYRPISSTPCIARLFERLVLARLQIYLKINNVIIMQQSGFRKARQTKDNLLYLIQSAQQGFNQDEKTLAIFFDIAAVFDKV